MGFYHKLTNRTDTRLSVYYIDITDYEVVDSAGLYYSSHYAYNLDSMKFYGIEWEFNTTLFDKLNLFGNYSFREMDKDKTDLPVVFWLNLPPKHKANLSLRYTLFKDTLLTFDCRYVGRRESEGSYTMDEYFVSDVGIEHTFLDDIKILFYANNILGENYEELYGYPMPDQVLGMQVKMSFF